jgi:alkylhydroperoxidase family enzyme
LQGAETETVSGVATAQLDKAKLDPKERALLDYVEVLTLRPAQVTDELVEGLRKKGWKDPEIFEASFITAIFAFFNRMAEAYGLDYAPGGWIPEAAAETPKK